jgi:L-ascorbate metabolism protein UlaG (beta-lactamase superfamily)
MKIYYIYHSCFAIETQSSIFIFDYFKNKKDPKEDFDFKELLGNILKSRKPLYIFSSHNHHDHFSTKVLSWINEKENTYYILSSDIKLYNKVKNLHTAKQGEEFTINNLKISTFGSTDQGISFLVNVDGINIFHAGDLNWWKWPDDTPEEEKEMEDAFKSIIDKIICINTNIDIAFFPVDGRLEDNYVFGGQYFIEKLKPKIFIPMHFWEDFKLTLNFKKSQEHTDTNVIEISHNNQIILS